ncbi:MAG TPA: helix-turn-helix domain-containing protein [Flavobacteriales bacterium]|jgi:methylphosphotriester-DNA--protein-cysteine methyltransferase|nr:helix-turn-helix domain-containing protein [Flavobacteriales bacterium]
MHYEEHPVPADLADVLRCTWSLVGDGAPGPADTEPILPDGCPELILNNAAPFEERVNGVFRVQPTRFLHGQLTRALHLRPHGACDIIGVRLQPHGAYALFGPAAVVADDKVELRALDPVMDAAFAQAVQHTEHEARIAAVIALLRALPRHPVERPITDLLQGIAQGADDVSLATLKADAALSPRQLERRFLAVVGLRPKAYARIVRLRRLIEHVRNGGAASFAELAHAAGYYDQAHFNRDLKAFTGQAPRAYFGQELVLPPYFSGVR